jgi:hypothetical protein
MHNKLTLRLEDRLIKRAKAWAKARGVSLSQVVGELFEQLRGKESQLDLSPWTRRLTGVVPRKGKAPTDEEIRRDYLKHLEKKHR